MPEADTFFLAADMDAVRAAAVRLFNATRSELLPLLPASAEILHVGATAIPGCLTKGDLDIVIRVDAADFSQVDAQLAERFSRNLGSVHTEEFAAFEDEACVPHLGIQLAVKGGSLDVFHRFVDALRSKPRLLRRYNDLKLAHQGKSMEQYRAAKDAFVALVLDSAA